MVITVSAISGVVESLPKKLQQLKQERSLVLCHIDHQSIDCLKDELELIRGAFEQYSTLDNPTEFTRQWVQKVREVAYDIEEYIDRYLNGVGDAKNNNVASGGALSRVTGYFKAKIKWGHAHRRSISDELKLQQERLHVKLLEKPAIMTTSTQRTTTTTVAELQLASRPLLVGMDEVREEVSKMVMADGAATMGVKVISIVGMVGSGKTTLAEEVYRHLIETHDFYCRAFISVGRRPDGLYTVLKDVLSKLGWGDTGCHDAVAADELNLKAIIRERLQHMRYFIVLDDLWCTEDWIEIKSCFPNNNLGSRIVATTRNEGVAKACCSSPGDSVYKIPLLNESDSETLFFASTFGPKNDYPQVPKHAFKHILRKCGGLPLAIVSISEDMKQLSGWEDYMQSKLYVPGIMKEVLDQSYNDIPPQLKTCLLYLAIFPENYEIRRQRLIRRWIAEGFIDEQYGIKREQTATHYFNELINRNLIQPGQVDYDGNTRSCRVHPVMRDFLVCMSMEENFVTVVHPGGPQNHTPDSNAIRWLSVHGKAKEDQGTAHNESVDLSHTRSLSLFGDIGAIPQLKKMEMLRVLDLEDCHSSVNQSLDVLPMLFMLRYLSLRGTDATKLPAQIGVLRHLETIDIRRTRIQKLPPSIVQLQKLVYLLAGMISLPPGVGKLKALQTLSYADISESTMSIVEELAHLKNLVKLAVFCSQEYRNRLIPVFQKLAGHSLRSLVVAGSNGCWIESSQSLPTPPRFSLQHFQIDESALNTIPKLVVSSSVNLVEMDISFHELSAQGLEVLEGMKSLIRLCLCLMFVQEEQLTFRNGGLPKLKELCFCCRNLPLLTFSAGALPMLKQLELNFQECPSSEEPIVSGLEYLASLMHAIIAFPHKDVGTKVVADVRKAALIHPNNPDVVVKMGKEVSSVGSRDFEELDRPSTNLNSVVSMEPDSNGRSLFLNLTVHIVSYSDVNQSGDFFGLFYMLLLIIYLQMLLFDKGRPNGQQYIYVDTGVSVVTAYALLLRINFQYFILIPFPICMVAFIAYLRNEILVKGKLQQNRKSSKETEKNKWLSRSIDVVAEKDRKKIEEHVLAEAIPYCMLSVSVLYGDGSPVLSHFLLFSCCVLGTLALMYSRLAEEVSPALKPALEYIQMAFMVMLFIAVHTVVAEWLGEVTVLVYMPELIAGLLWFSSLLQRGHFNRDSDQSMSDNYCFISVPVGAVLAGLTSTYGYEGELTKATVACGIAGCMPYLSVWMISRWPGGIPAAHKATQLLKFLGNICLIGACLMLLALIAEKTQAYRLLGLDDLINPSLLKYLPGFYFSTGVAWLVALFVTYLAGALLHIDYVMELPAGFAAE